MACLRKIVLLTTVFLALLPIAIGHAATGTIQPNALPQYFTSAGAPCASCRLFWFAAGTSTHQNAYSDVSLTTALANPTTLDSGGRIAAGGPYLDPSLSYKIVLASPGSDDPPASIIKSQDNVSAVPPSSTAADADITVTAGTTIASGDLCYISDGSGGNTVGRAYQTDADFTYASTQSRMIGIATAAISSGSTGTLRITGRATGLTGLVSGTVYYASATAGSLTSTAPTNARVVGIADSSTSLLISPWAGTVDASSTTSGVVSSGAQTLAGVKTFSSAVTLSSGATFASTSTLNNFIYAKQTSDLTKNSNTTLSDLTGLAFAVGASETWAFEFVMKGQSNATADFKFTLTGPSAPTAVWFGVMVAADLPTTAAVTAFSSTVSAGGSNTEELIIIRGLLRNGSNAGTVQAQMAQNTSDAGTTVIRAESYVLAWRVQ